MYKELIVALICVVTFNTATRVPHGEPVKKQAVYTGYNIPTYNGYQDAHYYQTPYPQNQVGVVAQGQSPQVTGGSAGTTSATVKQGIVPQKTGAYSPVLNSVSGQYSYPFKQYYPQIYPQNSQYPSVPSVFYVPSQGRFPQGTTENSEQGAGSGGSSGTWFGNNWSQNFPNWPSSAQSPQFPQFPSNLPQYPSNLPQYPSNFPQFPSQYPQFPSNFPTGAFPGGNAPSFPGGNFPTGAFPGASPAGSFPGASPAAIPGNEAGSSATTNAEGNSVVVVGARRPEKIESADSNVEGTKNDVDKVAADFPAQQYILLGQPQFLLQNGAQVPVVQNAAGKDVAQLDSAAKGAGSSFLYQPQQSAIAQQTSAQHFPHIPHNKIFSPQEFQDLIQQIQIANKKVLDGSNAASQFFVQQAAIPQRGAAGQQFVPQGIAGQQQSQDVPAQHVSGLVPQQYILQGVPTSAQVQQPFLQFSPQQQQFYVPQFASQAQQKPFGDVSSIPGASSAYQRFLLESQKPIKTSIVNQNVEGGIPVSGTGPTPVSIISSSIPSTVATIDASSSPEPSNDGTDSAGNASDAGTKNEADPQTINEANSSETNNEVNSSEIKNEAGASEAKSETNEIPATEDDSNEFSTTLPIKSSTEASTDKQEPLEFGSRLNIVTPPAQN